MTGRRSPVRAEGPDGACPVGAPGVTRRRFLAGGAAASAGLVAGCGAWSSTDDGGPEATGPEGRAPRRVPFLGPHQNGLTAPVAASGVLCALDVVAEGRDELAETLQAISAEVQRLMEGGAPPETDSIGPPPDNGVLGAEPPVADLSFVVSVGASLFDARFGLADERPRELVPMTRLANDRLDDGRTHGDLLLAVEGDSPDITLASLRQVLRQVRGTTVVRWVVEGHNRASPSAAAGEAPVRNLLGFKDGTANLDASDEALMDRHVWVGADDPEPAWAAGGSYQAVRTIRMFVELWDRTSLVEQEAVIGRHKVSGAPLGGTRETEVPDFSSDPDGEVTPLDAHIRLANPRTPETEADLILRRGLSYSRGVDGAGRLDQGLAFVSYQRSLRRGFLAVQERLAGEPLEEYVVPEGGGFFFALPGVPEDGGWLGQGLLA
ncbi:Dyp-type peroxidase [Iamia majanohamensis]|uniref:Dyp-type peroxidase n=1 Tax=Iamia majanohamensis TaxID=467976 RepID=A0AAF0BSX5_9ACTN|nr:Dyp-type peroxidase [Iamia majanohamensis]WCO65992.1 Dyp-type peroxidase [Iamia majanohamensis]